MQLGGSYVTKFTICLNW